MPGIFISYRREDSSGDAGRLFDILSARFGKKNTFMDLDTIQGGDDFSVVIQEKISASDVLVAVIGGHWLTVTEENGMRRLDNPRDFVRLEIGRALTRGIRVIPVLVGGAVMPRAEDLPDDLRPLSERQAVEVREAHFHQDAEQLIDVVHKALHGFSFRSPKLRGRGAIAATICAAGILIFGGVLLFRYSNSHAKSHVGDVAGRWVATVKYDRGDSQAEVFDFEVDGSELSGTASFLGSGRGILDGKIAGDRISFMTKSLTTISSDEQTHEDKHYYKGIVENGAILFTMLTDSSVESHVPIHFAAHRPQAH